MVKIKIHLFESVVTALMLPNSVFFIATMLLIVSLIVEQEQVVYQNIMLAYIISFILGIFLVSICFLINMKSKKEFVICDGKFRFLQNEYLIKQIVSCRYYVCKWYHIPIACLDGRGLIVIKLDSGKKIQFQIFYKDYQKLKKYINNILEG